MKMIRFICIVFVTALAVGCGNKNKVETTLVGFDLEQISDSESEWAIKRNHQGLMVEQGPVLNGLPNGAWTAYDFEKSTPKSITSLVAGKKSGPFIEFNKKSEMKLYAEFFNDNLHGKRIEFGTIGRFLKEAHYKHGVLHGQFKEWSNNGKLKKTMNYVDGKLHGQFAFYDQDGKMVAEYRYENGEKISGGVVEKELETKE